MQGGLRSPPNLRPASTLLRLSGLEIVWYTAMSMDGRIASADHSLEFLDLVPGPGANDFDEFIATVDGVLLGATTLRWLVRHGHGWPHDDLRTWLVSHDEAP